MNAEPSARPGTLRGLVAASLAVALLSGCAPLFPRPSAQPEKIVVVPQPQAAPAAAPAPPPCICENEERVETLWLFHRATRGLSPAALARERAALANVEATPLVVVQQALLLSRPPGGNLARALTLLDSVLDSEQVEAQALKPVTHLLADQLLERQRLEATNERLTHQLERTGQQLKESQRQADKLREKLEALAEIERTLPARPPAATPAEPVSPERRTPP